jgi:hypothetical protein
LALFQSTFIMKPLGKLAQRTLRVCVVDDTTESGHLAAQSVREVAYQGEGVTVEF